MKNILIATFLVLSGASYAQAGFLFEPGVGYESGKTTLKASDGTEDSSSTSAIAAGLRLGYRNGGFWLGVDANYDFGGKSKPETGESYDISGSTAYLAGGMDFPNRFRFWVGLGVMDSLTYKGTDASPGDTTYSGGMPFKIGIGFVVISHVSLNVEFVMHDYKKFKTDTLDGNLSDYNVTSLKNNSGILSISFPYSL